MWRGPGCLSPITGGFPGSRGRHPLGDKIGCRRGPDRIVEVKQLLFHISIGKLLQSRKPLWESRNHLRTLPDGVLDRNRKRKFADPVRRTSQDSRNTLGLSTGFNPDSYKQPDAKLGLGPWDFSTTVFYTPHRATRYPARPIVKINFYYCVSVVSLMGLAQKHPKRELYGWDNRSLRKGLAW